MPSISIIIPIYNESQSIEACMNNLESLAGINPVTDEIIFADGGSTDDTIKKIGTRFHVLSTPKGRARQMNQAAKVSKGDILWFSHCDNLLPKEAPNLIRNAVTKGSRFGCLNIDFDTPGFLMRINSYLSNRRAKLSQIAFGDQAIFIKRDLFENIGGFPNLPLMEDYELSRKLKAAKVPLTVIPSTVITSGRRYKGKPIRTMLQMAWLRHLYRRGKDINKIASRYRDIR